MFEVSDEDFEPLNWEEQLDLVDEAFWLPRGVEEALLFFDLGRLDPLNPGASIEAILAAAFEAGVVRLVRWGYLPAGDQQSRRAIATLESEWDASPLIRLRYGEGQLAVAVVSIACVAQPEVDDLLRQNVACLGIVPFDEDRSPMAIIHLDIG